MSRFFFTPLRLTPLISSPLPLTPLLSYPLLCSPLLLFSPFTHFTSPLLSSSLLIPSISLDRCITDHDLAQSSVPLSVSRTLAHNITAKATDSTVSPTATSTAIVTSNSTGIPSIIPDPFISTSHNGTGTGIPSPRVVQPSSSHETSASLSSDSSSTSSSTFTSSSSASSISYPVHKRVSDRRVQSRRFDQQCRLTSEVS